MAVNTDEALLTRPPLTSCCTAHHRLLPVYGPGAWDPCYKPLESSGVLSMSHLLSLVGSALHLSLLPTPNILVCWASLCIWLMNLSSVTLPQRATSLILTPMNSLCSHYTDHLSVFLQCWFQTQVLCQLFLPPG